MNLHAPVLLKEVIQYLQPTRGKRFVDGTLGGGGYTLALLKAGAEVLAIDLDSAAIADLQDSAAAKKYKDSLTLVHGNFADVTAICYERGFNQIDGIVLDLGLSSNQLADAERGFSFQGAGTLDMRFDPEGELTSAFEIINRYSENELTDIFRRLGEEVLARPIAKIIVAKRHESKISSPDQLAEIVATVYRTHFTQRSKVNPATKVFQALRLAVNHELDNLQVALPQMLEILRPGGRLVVVSFHSLEDRIVKQFLKRESTDCVCPPELPVCRCAHHASLKIITKKPIVSSAAELEANPRARSAKLRVAEKL
ncbi:16S rRNA (cytosine(1402)-N(4))-methyltransferase RsmH [Candidatus Falkowbacteria bacterium]|nr:16S rRNA (cytosine(1402)-N(4))-methyltransferase RsmH [Candidatus Falkowbacteria bacterium]